MPGLSANYDAWIARVRETNPHTGDWLRDSQALYVRFLKDVFLQQDDSVHPDPQWQHAPERSEIEVVAARQTDTATLERRPVLVVSRGTFQYGAVSVDLRHHEDMLTGEKRENDLLFGQYQVHCVAREDLTAERLAVWVARAFRHFRWMLRQAGAFQIGRRITVGPVQDAAPLIRETESERTFVAVTVTLPGVFQETAQITISDVDKVVGELTARLRGRGTFVSAQGTKRAYYPAQVDEDGAAVGPNVIVQPELEE